MRVSKTVTIDSKEIAEAIALWLTSKGHPCKANNVEIYEMTIEVHIPEQESEQEPAPTLFPLRSEVYVDTYERSQYDRQYLARQYKKRFYEHNDDIIDIGGNRICSVSELREA